MQRRNRAKKREVERQHEFVVMILLFRRLTVCSPVDKIYLDSCRGPRSSDEKMFEPWLWRPIRLFAVLKPLRVVSGAHVLVCAVIEHPPQPYESAQSYSRALPAHPRQRKRALS